MPYCPQCGRRVDETATFCPNCGASIKPEAGVEVQARTKETQRPRSAAEIREARRKRRAEMRELRREEKAEEKSEKEEKQEKEEKEEKHEKREPTVAGLLAGGFIIFFLGLMFYLQIVGYLPTAFAWPIWWLVVFVVLVILAVYGRRMARQRLPKT
jgi:cation transport ATPase